MLNQRELSRFRPVAKSAAVHLKPDVLHGSQRGFQAFLQLVAMARYDIIRFTEALIPPNPLDSSQILITERRRINQNWKAIITPGNNLALRLPCHQLSVILSRDFNHVIWH